MKYAFFLWLVGVCLWVSCKKETLQHRLEGTYIGTTHIAYSWRTIDTQVHFADTFYLDTFTVTLPANDSISFEHQGHQDLFKIDTSQIYCLSNGSHDVKTYSLTVRDSLKIDRWVYSGNGYNFSHTSTTFRGEKVH